jgi:hypothetical protein
VAEDYGEVTDRVYLSLLDMILNRETLYNTLEIGKINGLTLGQYYFCGILIFFLLLWGITSSVLFVKRDMSLTKFWKARGCRVAEQVAAEYLAYLLLMTVSILILFLPVKAILLLLDMELPGFLFLVRMLPVAAVIASLQFLLYELIVDMVSAVLVQFLMGVGLGYL